MRSSRRLAPRTARRTRRASKGFCPAFLATETPFADPAREAEQVARLRALAKEARLDPYFAEKFLSFIVREVIRHHEAIKDGR